MRPDPVLEWRRLTDYYRQMSDGELRELAAGFEDLTEAAQQALRGEFRSRGLADPQAPAAAPAVLQPAFTATSFPPMPLETPTDLPGSHLARAPELVSDAPGRDDEDSGPHEYTWKTVLCECDQPEQARQLAAALNRAGIECWIENQGTRSRYTGLGLTNIRIVVAADQLDQARIIAARPIPQDIVDESKIEVPEFVAPQCPQCRADDPILIAANPANTWRCEQCGKEWVESDQSSGGEGPDSDQNPS